MNAYRALGCAESATGDGRSGPRHLLGRAALATASLVVSAWVVNVVRLRAGVVGTRRYWSIPRGPAGGLLYVALGDSSAQGIGASRPDRGYVGLVAERVRARTGKDVQVINLSVSGARIDDLLEDQLPLLANLEADLVTVTIGGNDVHTYHAGTFAAQVDRLTAALPPGTFIADVPYFMHGHWERDAQQSADVLTRSASKRGLSVVPLHDALRRQGWSAMLTQFAADLFHPNDRGYRVWADAFWGSISHSPTLDVEATDGGRLRLDAGDSGRAEDRPIDRWQDDGGRVLSSTSGNSTAAASAVARRHER